jgi:hypothetical protein
MKGRDVKVGESYYAKVSGKRSVVRISAERINSGGRTYWEGVNVKTGRKVTIRGAGKLHPMNLPSFRMIDTDREESAFNRYDNERDFGYEG